MARWPLSMADPGNSFAVVREMRPVPFVTDDVVQPSHSPSIRILLT
jgi:hypothetical protein